MLKGLAAVSVAALVLASCGQSEGGTLEAIVEPEGETSGFTDFGRGPDKSFGIFICTRGGPVELESIEPVHTEGAIEFVGALVYTSEDRFVGAAHGYPPDGVAVTKVEPLDGTVVESDCDDPPGDDRVQLLVGAERTGPGGGVVDGLLISTDAGALEVPYTILLCGNEMEYCEVLIPEDG